MNTCCLVTGGAGFIGGHFVRQWLREEEGELVNLDKLTYAANPDSLCEIASNPRYHFVNADIIDEEAVREVLEKYRPRSVVHLAAETHVDRSIADADIFVETNVVGTQRLLEASLDYYRSLSEEEQEAFRFLHVSTDEVYGPWLRAKAANETAPYHPSSPYAASKAAADHFVRAYHRTHDLPVLLTHCTNNFGPWQHEEKLIPMAILAALGRRPIPLYGDGLQRRDWLYVEDHCRALRLVLKQGHAGETYHIAAGSEKSNLKLVEAICDWAERLVSELSYRPIKNLITRVDDRPGHDRRYALDTTKIKTELHWTPEESFSTGLEKTIRWYWENRKKFGLDEEI